MLLTCGRRPAGCGHFLCKQVITGVGVPDEAVNQGRLEIMGHRVLVDLDVTPVMVQAP